MALAGGDGAVGEEVEGAVKERGHLGSINRSGGAETERILRAAPGDVGRSQRVDAGLMRAACNVTEPGRICGLDVEGAHQERRHMGSAYVPIGAVLKWRFLAAHGDLQLCEPLDVGRPRFVGVDVGESRGVQVGGVLVLEDAYEPHGHDGAGDRIARTEPVLTAQSALEHTQLIEGVDGGLMGPRGHIREPGLNMRLGNCGSCRRDRRRKNGRRNSGCDRSISQEPVRIQPDHPGCLPHKKPAMSACPNSDGKR